MTTKDIRQYWDDKAEALKTDPSATMKDVILRSLEIEAIQSRLRPEDDLLDVGGGNAFAGLQWAQTCRSVHVVDASEKMIRYGDEAIAQSSQENITSAVANVLDLQAYAGKYSAVSCVRCLINLPSPNEQLAAIDQLADTLQPGGRLFLIEGLEETFAGMNQARRTMNLPEIKLDWHNLLLSRPALEAKLNERFTIEQRVDFGEYYFLSRIVHPLLVAPDEPAFRGPCNIVAKSIWEQGLARGYFASISILMLYVASRR